MLLLNLGQTPILSIGSGDLAESLNLREWERFFAADNNRKVRGSKQKTEPVSGPVLKTVSERLKRLNRVISDFSRCPPVAK